MIFKRQLYEKILNGTKTQTRRPVKPDEIRCYQDPNGILWYVQDKPSYIPTIVRLYDARIKWQVGRNYAVQRAAKGRRGGEKAGGRFLLKAIRQEQLQEISYRDIRAEGLDMDMITSDWFAWRNEGFPEPQGLGPGQRAFYNLWNSIHVKPNRWEDNPLVWVLEFELVKGEA